MKFNLAIGALAAALAAMPFSANALGKNEKGCLVGGAVGGVGGHLVGGGTGGTVVGALGGCAVGTLIADNDKRKHHQARARHRTNPARHSSNDDNRVVEREPVYRTPPVPATPRY